MEQSGALVFFHNQFSDSENIDTGNTLGELLLALNHKLPIYLLRDKNLPWLDSKLSKMSEFAGLSSGSEEYDPKGSVWKIMLRRWLSTPTVHFPAAPARTAWHEFGTLDWRAATRMKSKG
ncbi:MAG TPA: hypothetical protein VMD27_09620 [Candidatus Aquilonibacter sp.]|nr:hypothetical protein [Candidatus Aquilonibacter sp.]